MMPPPSKANPAAALDAATLARWNMMLSLGKQQECEQDARRFVERLPADGKAWQLLGAALMMRGAFDEARPVLEHASRLSRDDASILDNLGLCLTQLGEQAAAADTFRKSLRLDPRIASTWTNASNNALIANDFAEAQRLAARAVALAPGQPDAQLALGNALSALGRSDEALAALQTALKLRPLFPQALVSLGIELARHGRHVEASQATRRAIELNPDYTDAHLNLANQLSWLGDTAGALVHFRRARSLDPMRDHAWSGVLYCLSHDESVDPAVLRDEHRAFGEWLESKWRDSWGGHQNDRSPQRRLRVGFVSGDLRDHPVARFIEPVWRELSPQQVELFAYMNYPFEDQVSQRLRALASVWRSVPHMSDDELFAQIRQDGIDILFDLSGHTAHNRLALFARKPAPVQVTWIGYPGSTGLAAIDYRPVDEVIAPPGQFDRAYSERLAYLPAASVFGRPESLPDVAPLPALARGRFTFGSFNRPNKIGDQVIELWSRVLRSVPDSQLLIGAVADEAAGNALRARFAQHGIDADRLLLRPRVEVAEYLQMHADVDLLLDTFPFAGGTTANFALWMGVPVVTLVGPVAPQRIGASRLAAAGLHEFIAETPQAYHDIAVSWAQRLPELAALRAELRQRVETAAQSAPQQLARALEQRLRQMWQRWCDGLPAETLH